MLVLALVLLMGVRKSRGRLVLVLLVGRRGSGRSTSPSCGTHLPGRTAAMQQTGGCLALESAACCVC